MITERPEDPLATRRAGILLHPTSLPTGILDGEVWRWLDFLSDAGITVWQTLPLGVPQSGLSPYQCDSAFALNPALEDQSQVETIDEESFQEWQIKQHYWLDDYALFAVLKNHFDQSAWFDWPDDFRSRKESALTEFSQDHAGELQQIKRQQFRLYSLWQKVRQYAFDRGIYLFGDIPIYVALDSTDVWAHRSEFLLDETGHPLVVTGVPPDYFSETGQRWGNPHYHWQNLESTGFEWWVQRIKFHFECFDFVRIDHFRGLESAWMIDAKCDTAVDGYWQKVPGDALLQKLSSIYQPLALVAEDLGVITTEVTALRDKYHLPGMAVMQFSFDHFEDNPHKPDNIRANTVVYSGTHDNDTTRGWFHSLSQQEQEHVLHIIGASDKERVTDTIVKRALATQANLAVVPLQDFLDLGSGARMNVPGVADGNWRWRFDSGNLTPELARHIHHMLDNSGRLP